MNTFFLLVAQYDAAAIIPLEKVRADYFSHLSQERLEAKCLKGEIPLPVVRLDPDSQKSARGVPLEALAKWIDTRRTAAENELHQVSRR